MPPVERSWSSLRVRGERGGGGDETDDGGTCRGPTLPVWVAVTSRTTRGPGVLRLVQAFGERGVAAHPVRPAEFAAVASRHPPVAAVLRLPSGAPESELEALAPTHGETDSIVWINSASAVASVHDKLGSLALLEQAGIPVPPTTLVVRDLADDLSSLPGDQFVVKPWRGAAGHGVTVGLDRERAVRHARAFAELTGNALVQSCLGTGLDRRMFIIDGVLVAAMERRPTAHGRGSVLYGGAAHAWQPNDSQRALGLRAAAVLGLDVAAVDILDDHGRDVLLEVNACPGFAAIEAVTGLDIAGMLADATIRRCALR